MKCSGDATTCTACDFDAGNTVYLSDNKCVAACPDRFYGVTNVAGNTCSSCSDGCKYCYDTGFNKCTACTQSTTGTAYYKKNGVD